MKKLLGFAVMMCIVAVGIGCGYQTQTYKADEKVLILSTIQPNTFAKADFNRDIKIAVIAVGKEPVVVGPAIWSKMTPAQFDEYSAIALDDPVCGERGASIRAIEATKHKWRSVIDGNVVVIGSDDKFNLSYGFEDELNLNAMAFATSEIGKTGLFISLKCYSQELLAH